jgi:hypothetical protein
MTPRTCPTTSQTKRQWTAGCQRATGTRSHEAVADGVAVDDDVAVPDDELETVALLLGVAELELEADALPDKTGVADELEDVDPGRRGARGSGARRGCGRRRRR